MYYMDEARQRGTKTRSRTPARSASFNDYRQPPGAGNLLNQPRSPPVGWTRMLGAVPILGLSQTTIIKKFDRFLVLSVFPHE